MMSKDGVNPLLGSLLNASFKWRDHHSQVLRIATTTETVQLSIGVILALSAWYFCVPYLRPHLLSTLTSVPGPKGGHFLFGQSKYILDSIPAQPLLEWMDTIPNRGFIRYFSFLNTQYLLPTTPEALNIICNREVHNFVKTRSVRAFMTKAMGMGMIFSEGEQHKHQRGSLQRAFSYQQLQKAHVNYWDKSNQLRSLLNDRIAPGDYSAVIEMYEMYARAALDLLCIGAFDYNFDTLRYPDHPLNRGATSYRTSRTRKRTTAVRFMISEFLPSWITQILSFFTYRDLRRTYEPARTCFRAAIRLRRSQVATGTVTGGDLLTLSITSGKFNDDEIVDNMLGMYFAGTHSTAAALSWATYLLCKHPKEQERLRDELKNSLLYNDISNGVGVRTVASLPYLTAIVHETLRLYPPIPVTVRESVKPTTIAGTYIPAGTKIALAPGATNRCAAIWGPDARDFRPSRWLNDAGKFNRTGGSKNGSNWDILTFLHGPRNCIGQDMARTEIAVVLAVMFSSFEFSLADPAFVAVPTGSVIMRPAQGLPVRIRAL